MEAVEEQEPTEVVVAVRLLRGQDKVEGDDNNGNERWIIQESTHTQTHG